MLTFCLVTLVRMRFFCWAYNFNMPIFVILYAGAVLTSLYMFRLYFITFEGQARSDHSSKAVENSFLMTGPLLILALLSIVGGYFSLYPTRLGSYLGPDLAVVSNLPHHMWMVVLGTSAIIGLLFPLCFTGKLIRTTL